MIKQWEKMKEDDQTTGDFCLVFPPGSWAECCRETGEDQFSFSEMQPMQ